MLKSLLDRGRVLARAYSVQLAAIGVILSTLLAIDPVALQAGWESMPPELRALIPANVATWINGLLFVLVIAARALPQKGVTQRLAMLGAVSPFATTGAPTATKLGVENLLDARTVVDGVSVDTTSSLFRALGSKDTTVSSAVRPSGFPFLRVSDGVAAKWSLVLPAWVEEIRKPIARKILGIVIHCSATRQGQYIDAAEVRRWHLAKKWADIGYHFFIRLDGTIEVGRPLALAGAHVEGSNLRTIGICYAGGLAVDGKTPKDTRTPQQKAALVQLLTELRTRFPTATIKGHRDYSPDTNGNGRIDKWEWLKACPCFDAAVEYAGIA